MNIIFKNQKDKYSFQSKNVKIEFSDPHIQSYDEYGACTSEKSILYYYYTVTAYIKDDKKWKQLFELGTYDFPEIITFKNILKAFMDNEIDICNYQKDDIDDDIFRFSYTIDTRSFCEDFYSVTHCLIKEENKVKDEHFGIVVGKPFGYDVGEITSISLNLLSREDIKVIFDCVSAFIEYSVKKEHDIIVKRNKKGLNSWKIVDKKLYEMSSDKKSINAIYTIGDEIDDAMILHGDMNSDKFYSTRFCRFVIKDITKDGIILDSGYEEVDGEYRKIKKEEEIKLNVLIDLFDEINDDKVKYNETEITDDFINILSDKEKNEFRTNDIDILFDKYSEAILNRTWMCRKEHKLPKRIEDTGYNENVYASIKVIIENIKKKLK